MLFKKPFLDRLATGEITVAFRRWRRPTVRAGGTLKTPAGVLAIDDVRPIQESDITEADARSAGYASRRELVEDLNARPEGALYRVDLRYAGADPRIALREQADLTEEQLAALRQRLSRLDAASRTGPWTAAVLRLIGEHPGIRAGDLAPRMQQDIASFKRDVRKLKNLGLTESLETGYRLSPLGLRVLSVLNEISG